MQLDADTSRDPRPDPRGLEILARSLFRQMRAQGYSQEQIIGLSAELIQLVREDLCSRHAGADLSPAQPTPQ